MNQNVAIFLVVAVALVAAVTLVLGTTWIRAKHRSADLARKAAADADDVAALTQENQGLRSVVERLENRLQVLERIATDPATRTAAEIEALR